LAKIGLYPTIRIVESSSDVVEVKSALSAATVALFDVLFEDEAGAAGHRLASEPD
jgi:hypothetical protein